jgi:predicted N-formylglutamate amidohydrolase
MKHPTDWSSAGLPDEGVATILAGGADSDLLLVVDHASNHVPGGIDLGVAPALLDTHIAIDIGSAALARRLAAMLDAPACLANLSRLVVDLNRDPTAAGVIPQSSDGHAITGNRQLTEAERRRRLTWHDRYHSTVGELAARAGLLVSVHSFTPCLESAPAEPRPWPVGILHNRDDRAARIALDHLARLGIDAGDNQPYSGKLLNYTMDRHAEARGTPYLGIEVRQDEIGDAAGVERWATILAPIIRAVAASMIPSGLTLTAADRKERCLTRRERDS